MKQKYRIRGRYMARYPDGHSSGEIGTSIVVRAKSEQDALKAAAKKMQHFYKYSTFDWINVVAESSYPGTRE